jgi:hypothetical protein
VRYIPEWLPWLSYKPLARYGYDLGQEVLHAPMEFVRETIVGILTYNDILQETEQLDEPERETAEQVIARALGSVYSGR